MSKTTEARPDFLDEGAVHALNEGRHGSPFDVLGPHKVKNRRWITTFQPGATEVLARVGKTDTPLDRIAGDVFAAPVPGKDYQLVLRYAGGAEVVTPDPYSFGQVLTDFDQYLMGEGTHKELWRALGAHVREHEGVRGTHFAVWAPNANRVSLVGDFNFWDGRRHVMRRVGSTGVWEIFMPGVGEGALYKYEVLGADGSVVLKADPVGFGSQHPPEKASVVREIGGYGWKDADWMQARKARGALDGDLRRETNARLKRIADRLALI